MEVAGSAQEARLHDTQPVLRVPPVHARAALESGGFAAVCRAPDTPELPEMLHSLLGRAAGYDGGVCGADRGASNPVDARYRHIVQRGIRTTLTCAEADATRKNHCDAPVWQHIHVRLCP